MAKEKLRLNSNYFIEYKDKFIGTLIVLTLI